MLIEHLRTSWKPTNVSRVRPKWRSLLSRHNHPLQPWLRIIAARPLMNIAIRIRLADRIGDTTNGIAMSKFDATHSWV